MRRSIFISSVLILFLFLGNINATTYYVANSGGNDANSGTSASTAWKSISKVNSKSFNSGDIISFQCGDRFSDATLVPPTNYLTFNSYGSGPRPVIDGQSSRICVDMLRITRNNITFDGLKFVNGFRNNILMWNCNNITFESCNIDSSRGGTITYSNVYAGQGNNLIIKNSTISYGAQSTNFDGNLGIYLDGSDNALLEHDTLIGSFSNIRVAFGTEDLGMANGLIVRYCVVKNGRYDNVDEDGSAGAKYYYNIFEATNINIYLFTDGSGSYDQYATRNSSYFNNTFITHGNEASIHLNSKTGVNNGMIFKNNIFYSDNSSGYFFYEEVSGQMGTFTLSNNLYYMTSTTSHGWVKHGQAYSSLSQWLSSGNEVSSIYADPLFMNYADKDFSLRSGSKAMNSGTNVGLTTDLKGTIVPATAPDLGAYQHKSNTTTVINSESTESTSTIPKEFSIGNYPNPFNPSTKINYSIPSESAINLVIYNILGQKIEELRNDIQQPGNYELNWNASNHPSGIYLLSITEAPTNGSTKISKTIKMNLIK
jgi:hypothetical protein